MSKPADMKAGLTNAKPKLSLLGQHAIVHLVRAKEYGCDAYARGNYHREPPEGVDPVDRFLGYIDAAMRHLTSVAQAINVARGRGGDQVTACSVVDDVPSSTGFPPSLLPHMAHAIASLSIGIEVGVQDKLLPADPGQPWKQFARSVGSESTEFSALIPSSEQPVPSRMPTTAIPGACIVDAQLYGQLCAWKTRGCTVTHPPLNLPTPTEAVEDRAKKDAEWLADFARAAGVSTDEIQVK